MIDFENRTEQKIDLEELHKIGEYLIDSSLKSRDLELIVVDSGEIREINREHRGIDKATDVLSFPIDDDYQIGLPIGTVIICDEFIKSGSKQFNHTENEETQLLFTHGLLHLLGFDHETDSGEMREMEKRVIEKFNLPNSLIVRVDG
jgi:probable rRNA maturation factor